MGNLKGKVAVVTGASKGIGAGIAKALAAEAASVVVNYAGSKEGADRVVAEIVSKDGKAIAVQGNVSIAADVKRLFEETKKAFGKLDVLVNNAGVFAFHPLEAVTEDEFHRQFNINVLGPLLTTRESLQYFGAEGGSVINVSSVSSMSTMPATSVYSATKGALDSITRVLAAELGARKIRVNTIAPGPVDTEGARDLGVLEGNEFTDQIIAKTPLGRLGNPNDIAKAAVFLASDASSWVTGDRLLVAGGLNS